MEKEAPIYAYGVDYIKIYECIVNIVISSSIQQSVELSPELFLLNYVDSCPKIYWIPMYHYCHEYRIYKILEGKKTLQHIEISLRKLKLLISISDFMILM